MYRKLILLVAVLFLSSCAFLKVQDLNVPTKVEYLPQLNKTEVHFQISEPLTLEGNWQKTRETVNKRTIFCAHEEGFQLGFAKSNKKHAGFQDGESDADFLDRYVQKSKAQWAENNYQFSMLEEKPEDSFLIYKVWQTGEQMMILPNSDTTYVPPHSEVVFVGLKDTWLFQFRGFPDLTEEGIIADKMEAIYRANN